MNEIDILSNYMGTKRLPKGHRDELNPPIYLDFSGYSQKEAKNKMDKAKSDLKRIGWKINDRR